MSITKLEKMRVKIETSKIEQLMHHWKQHLKSKIKPNIKAENLKKAYRMRAYPTKQTARSPVE